MKRFFSSILEWLERGDLVPLIVLVSAVHYALILKDRDLWPVAIAIGILVDLGHYRWTRAAVRYQGANQRERAVRWSLAIGMTAISLAYQQRYYADWWYSIPLPLLIISLAWLGETDKRRVANEKPAVAEVEVTPVAETALPAPVEQFVCDFCQYVAKSQQGLNAHMRKHPQRVPDMPELAPGIISSNGHKEKS